MKNIYYSLFLCLSPIFALGQDDKSLDPLKAPAMPASSIIGAQSNEVSRPKSLKGLETALINNGASTNGMVFPNSFALEINPYMLSPRKNFDYLEYIQPGNDSILKNMAQNFSISMSTTQNYSLSNNTSVNAFGVGIRTIILNGNVNPKIAKAFKSSLENNERLQSSNGKIRSRIRLFLRDSITVSKPFDKEALKAYLMNYYSKNSKGLMSQEVFLQAINVIDNLPKDIKDSEILNAFNDAFTNDYTAPNLIRLQALLSEVKMNRYGWRWDAQAALGTVFPTNDFSYGVVPRWGIWTNISYKPLLDKDKFDKNGKPLDHISNFEFIGMFRLLQNNNDFFRQFATEDSTFKAGDFIDLGGRVVYEYKQFSLEAEAIYRINSTESTLELVKKNSSKYLVNINYNIKDNIVVSYYIGKEFDQAALANGNLISGLSLNFGFGDMKLSDLEKKP
jgi:hypothetical protein